MSVRDQPRPQVLVALDGSPAAATALPVAEVVARQLGADVSILHVPSEETPLATLRRSLRQQAANGLPLRLIEAPEPVAGILDALADPRVVLVVLTTHGREIDPRRGLGRVAEAVIAWTTRPILLVRPEAAESRPPAELRHLLVPLDGTPTTAMALRPAADLACQLGASIDLLYVASAEQERPAEPGSIGAPRYVDQPQHEWPAWAAEAIDRLACRCAQLPREVPVRMFLAHGRIGPEIARFAAERHIDAIVLARRSHLEPGRARVLRAVLARTPCPILLVGHETSEAEDRSSWVRAGAAITGGRR